MAERKVLNKYYPPDFDPAKIRRFEKKTARKISNVRMMLPMSVRCSTCGNYMYLGTKFNMKVEAVSEDDYLGIKVHRFYFKCTRCYAQVSFKTDPKNHDYVSEWGASRNHEPWKDMLMAEEEFKEVKKSEMKEDAMRSLEYRTYDSKREMDILDAIDQTKNINRREAILNHTEIAEKALAVNNTQFEKDIDNLYEERRKIIRIDDLDNPDLEAEVQKFDMNKEFNKIYEDEEVEEEDEEPKLFSGLCRPLTSLKVKKCDNKQKNAKSKTMIKEKGIIDVDIKIKPKDKDDLFKKPITIKKKANETK